MEPIKSAICRYCHRILIGPDYEYGGQAYDPDTGRPCKRNHYGGYVCSAECDRKLCIQIESSFPGFFVSLSNQATRTLVNNWGCDTSQLPTTLNGRGL
jgi:hypothetical protein